jgi:hypothetical protein
VVLDGHGPLLGVQQAGAGAVVEVDVRHLNACGARAGGEGGGLVSCTRCARGGTGARGGGASWYRAGCAAPDERRLRAAARCRLEADTAAAQLLLRAPGDRRTRRAVRSGLPSPSTQALPGGHTACSTGGMPAPPLLLGHSCWCQCRCQRWCWCWRWRWCRCWCRCWCWRWRWRWRRCLC